MAFFDEEYMSLPDKARYYFNILVICIAVSPEDNDNILPDGVTNIWFLDNINDARPWIIHFYLDDESDDTDIDYSIEFFPHSVVEIHDELGISFYNMLDFNTTDFWRID